MVKDKIEKGLQDFINQMNEEMEGTIHVDENGLRWRFHNGRWEGMCTVEPIKFEPKIDIDFTNSGNEKE